MDVARARRRVEDEIVELSPVGVGDELLQCAGGHAAAPERGRIGGDKESYRQQFHAVFLHGHDQVPAVLSDGVGALVLHVEHLGHRGSEDVGVEQSDAVAEPCQGDGEVGRDGRLAYASLARADGDDVLHAGQHLARLGPGLRLELGLDLHLHVLSAVILDGGLGGLDGGFQEGVGVAGELHHHLHLPLAALFLRGADGGGVGHHPALHHILLRAGIHHRCQRVDNHLGV